LILKRFCGPAAGRIGNTHIDHITNVDKKTESFKETLNRATKSSIIKLLQKGQVPKCLRSMTTQREEER